jgi:hypothetical protein
MCGNALRAFAADGMLRCEQAQSLQMNYGQSGAGIAILN